MNPILTCFLAGLILTATAPTGLPGQLTKPRPAVGLLRVHPKNPRYFTDGTKHRDGTLRAIYLGGHQIFVDNLARMNPRQDLTSTKFCLAHEGHEYIVYVPRQEAYRVAGLQVGQKYDYEWFNCRKATVHGTGQIAADAAAVEFRPPCEEAVLFLTLVDIRQ